MLRIEILPAHHGDSVLIEWGTPQDPHRILVDGGTESSADAVKARLAKIGKPAKLDLVMVTHVDEDHIGGMLKLLIAEAFETKDFWFNSYENLFREKDKLGAQMGEGLTTAIKTAGFTKNAAWDGHSVVVPDEGPLPVKTLAGATLTLLSPSWDKLDKLLPLWEAECKKAHITPGGGAEPEDVLGKHPPPTNIDVDKLLAVPFKQDGSAANGSCIAFLFEYDGKRVLFGADAHPSVVLASLKRLSHDPVKLDAFKLCHHGSRNNTTTALLDHVQSERFLVSSNGETFGHPDPETIARVVSREGTKTLCFNYDTDYTQPWNREALRDKYDYAVRFPEDDAAGFVLEL